MNPFPHIYYSAAALAAVAALLAVCIQRQTFKYAGTAILVAPIVLVYVLGMYRIDGVDFGNYHDYMVHPDLIPDVGYRLLMQATTAVGLSLTEFFLLQGLFSLYAVCLLANKLRSDLVVAIVLYMLHGALARDFSQSRIALALAIYFVALAQDRKLVYGALTLAACSVHLQLVPLVFVYHWAKFVVGLEKRKVFFAVAPAVVLVASVALLLKVLVLIDPRVEVYLNWTEDLYGNPVDSYTGLLLFLVIAAICYRAQRITGDKEMQVFLIMIMYAAAIFIAFRDVAIFAFRLSNGTAALYPFAVGRAVTLLRSSDQERLHHVVLSLGLLGALLLAVLFRSGSLDILLVLQPAMIAY